FAHDLVAGGVPRRGAGRSSARRYRSRTPDRRHGRARLARPRRQRRDRQELGRSRPLLSARRHEDQVDAARRERARAVRAVRGAASDPGAIHDGPSQCATRPICPAAIQDRCLGWSAGGGDGGPDPRRQAGVAHFRVFRPVGAVNGGRRMAAVKIGIIGSRFQADCIAGAVKATADDAEVVAVASPTPGHAASFAKRHGIPRSYTDYRDLLRDPDVEMISITAPNRLHAQITIEAARARKHVVCEKPLCLTLEEADAMIDACRRAGVLLLYAEELFFAPKYAKAKQLADEGAFGRVHLVKQGEKHSGPHSDWFWDVEQSGGGAVMDLGCHGIAFCWWFLGRQQIKSVYSHMATQHHQARTQGDDEAVTIIEFANGAVGMVESSWNRPGGMDDCIEVFGDQGQTYADLLMGNALPTYSEAGFGYAVEKA